MKKPRTTPPSSVTGPISEQLTLSELEAFMATGVPKGATAQVRDYLHVLSDISTRIQTGRSQSEIIEDIAALPGAQGFAQGRYAGAVKSVESISRSSRQKEDKRLIHTLESLDKKMSTPFMGVIVADEKNMLQVQKALDRLARRQKNSRTF